ncbi:MAG: HAD family hydrolase [bacterium]|nr:HAD family hydrolase [bacterium]
MKRVITFDLDDTLYPEREYAESGLRCVGTYLESAHGVVGAADELLAIQRSGVRGQVFNRLARTGAFDEALIPELVNIYRGHFPDIAFYRDVIPTLAQLRECHLAVITDGPLICQQQKIAALGLARYVELIVCTDEAGRPGWKPSPYGYRKVAEYFGVAPESCWYIGDNPIKDFVGARSLGWVTVHIEREDVFHPGRRAASVEAEAHFRIGGLAELFSLFEVPGRQAPG